MPQPHVLLPPAPLPNPAPERSAGLEAQQNSRAVRECPAVDGFRVLAAFAVVCLHTEPFSAERLDVSLAWSAPLAWGINLLALFAVPYFFIASGHFFARRTLGEGGAVDFGALSRLLRRILPMFLGWSLFYALMPRPFSLNQFGFWGALERNFHALLRHAAGHPLHLLLNGTGLQLWFLASLCLAAAMAAIILRWRPKLLAPLAIGLFAFGLLGQGYGALFGIDAMADWGLNTRLGPFYGFPLFALGILQARRAQPTPRGAASFTLLALGILLAEGMALSLAPGRPLPHYYAGSALLGLGVFRLALAHPLLFGAGFLPRLGLLTPGVYVIHVFLLSVLDHLPLLELGSVSAQVFLPFGLFALSALCAAALADTPLLRRLV